MINFQCCVCGWIFGLPDKIYDLRMKDGESFWCPLGHQQGFIETPDKRAIKELANEVDWLQERLRESVLENEELRKKSCPVCDGLFLSVGGHMAKAHPKEWEAMKGGE